MARIVIHMLKSVQHEVITHHYIINQDQLCAKTIEMKM